MQTPEGIATSFSLFFYLILRNSCVWEICDPLFIGAISFDVGRKTGLPMGVWGQFKTHTHSLSFLFLFLEGSLFFSLNSQTFSETHFWWYSPFLVWLLIPRCMVCWGPKCSFKLTAQLTPAAFKDHLRSIFLVALQ